MAFSNFSDIRKSRGSGISSLLKEVEKLSTPSNGGSQDDRFWQPELDKAGNGMATIRFLAAAPENDYPWVRVFNHGFKNDQNGKWYIEECNTTINGECPVCQRNSELWNTGTKENQDIVRNRKRKLHYISNILVINDPKNPDNNGKVFLFKYGAKVFEKVKNLMSPTFEDETPIDPFDFWEGANFKLKIIKVDGYRNYDRSEFESPSAISDDESEIERIWKQEHDLREFTDPKRFKPYDELKKRLDAVLGNAAPIKSAQQQAEDELNQFIETDDVPPPPSKPQRSTEQKAVPNRTPKPPVDDDDDEAKYFASLLTD